MKPLPPLLRRPLGWALMATAIGASGWVQAQTTLSGRTVLADVVALDQPIVYNRFGSHNPYAMMYALKRDVIDLDSGKTLDKLTDAEIASRSCRVALKPGKRPRPMALRANLGDRVDVKFTNLLCASASGMGTNKPMTRVASMMFNGVQHLKGDPSYNTFDPRITGISGIHPGQTITYKLVMEREGSHLIHDNGAPSGGESDGGSNSLGLFGALHVEPRNAKSYRSQVAAPVMAAAKAQAVAPALLNYEAVDRDGSLTGTVGLPLLNMHRDLGGNRVEMIYTDLNAIIQDFTPQYHGKYKAPAAAVAEGYYREFTVIFHDELKTVQAFGAVFDHEGVGSGVRDGFGINYGASGVGAIVAANRLGLGPAKDCVECAFEEFFLTSWANGDPAMIVAPGANGVSQLYPDDAGNVHHSYLGDNIKFRNLQAGAKETHVFHLHAHQWFTQPSSAGGAASYLDSQTIGPMQVMNYTINWKGGNRNKTIGDSIYHCHLYPHFAQGMWALWRTHDVFEDGTRRLPDGELGAGTDPMTGQTAGGAFSPAVIPIRGNALPPEPTYGANGMPGYPFFIAGKAGRRPPQPPLDLAQDSQLGATGLGRHRIDGGTRVLGAGGRSGDWSSIIKTATLELLPNDGTQLEKNAMAYHANTAGFQTKTVDGQAATFQVNGRPAVSGAPFSDPCPADAPVREYRVSAVQLDLVVNKQGWHDPQARINVLTSEVAAYEGKRRTAEPFFFRAHSGECINFYHQNRLPAELALDAFQVRTPTDTIGQHIHLVKFDVTSADGSANGWNYEDGTFAREALIERIHAAKAVGGALKRVLPDGTIVPESTSVLPADANLGFQTTIQRWWADPLLDAAGKDRTLRTVFTHDHFGASSIQQHGFYGALVIQPVGSTWLKPDGTPLTTGVGSEAMILNAADKVTHPDTREFMLAVADFSLIYKADGTPVDPPPLPEIISTHHHNPYMVNYKMEAIPLRLASNGDKSGLYTDARAELSNVFSSSVHGDPFTPVFKAYEGDRVAFRLIQGAQEVQNSFHVHGLRWKREVGDPTSPYVGAQEVGISEHFEMDIHRLPNVAGGANTADYLYHFGSTDSLWNGTWGLLRTFATPTTVDPVTKTLAQSSLAPLPGNPRGRATAAAVSPIKPDGCPTNAPIKNFSVEAWAARDLLPGGALVYNQRAGITDPSALLYVHTSDVLGLRNGSKTPEPLVIRANAGDCIKVKLTNKLPATKAVPDMLGDAMLPTITSLNADDLRPSRQVGLHAMLVSYDVRNSDGANVGYNPQQTVGSGASRTYTWYAGKIEPDATGRLQGVPVEFGTIPLRSMSDPVKQGSQGLLGVLVVEPAGATYYNEANTALQVGGTKATIRVPATATQPARVFKENVLVYQDGLNLRLRNGTNHAEIAQHWVGDDTYDMGERALNYRTEPLATRIDFSKQSPTGGCSNLTQVLANDINPCVLAPNLMVDNDARLPAELRGLPVETPIFSAKPGEEVVFRVTQPDGRARQHSFRIGGHNYADMQLEDYVTPGNSIMTPGKAINVKPYGGAQPGYWQYRDGPSMFVNTGVWGLFKVQ